MPHREACVPLREILCLIEALVPIWEALVLMNEALFASQGAESLKVPDLSPGRI